MTMRYTISKTLLQALITLTISVIIIILLTLYLDARTHAYAQSAGSRPAMFLPTMKG